MRDWLITARMSGKNDHLRTAQPTSTTQYIAAIYTTEVKVYTSQSDIKRMLWELRRPLDFAVL